MFVYQSSIGKCIPSDRWPIALKVHAVYEPIVYESGKLIKKEHYGLAKSLFSSKKQGVISIVQT